MVVCAVAVFGATLVADKAQRYHRIDLPALAIDWDRPEEALPLRLKREIARRVKTDTDVYLVAGCMECVSTRPFGAIANSAPGRSVMVVLGDEAKPFADALRREFPELRVEMLSQEMLRGIQTPGPWLGLRLSREGAWSSLPQAIGAGGRS